MSESPKKQSKLQLPLLYVLPGASDGPDGMGKPDVEKYEYLGDELKKQGLIEGMVVVAYNLHAESYEATMPAKLSMPADGQEAWLLIHSFGINFANALMDVVKPTKFYVYGPYCAKWKVEKKMVVEDSAEYRNYNYKMLCAAKMPDVSLISHFRVGQYEGAEEIRYVADECERAGMTEFPMVVHQRHGAVGAMGLYPKTADIMTRNIIHGYLIKQQ